VSLSSSFSLSSSLEKQGNVITCAPFKMCEISRCICQTEWSPHIDRSNHHPNALPGRLLVPVHHRVADIVAEGGLLQLLGVRYDFRYPLWTCQTVATQLAADVESSRDSFSSRHEAVATQLVQSRPRVFRSRTSAGVKMRELPATTVPSEAHLTTVGASPSLGGACSSSCTFGPNATDTWPTCTEAEPHTPNKHAPISMGRPLSLTDRSLGRAKQDLTLNTEREGAI
jgi:hypothetical protein